MKQMSPRQAIRKKCLDCCGGNFKAIKYCTIDGVNSAPKCPLWECRFGKTAKTVKKLYGPQFLSPKDMPPASVDLDDLPR